MMIGQLCWEKIALIRAVKHLAATQQEKVDHSVLSFSSKGCLFQ